MLCFIFIVKFALTFSLHSHSLSNYFCFLLGFVFGFILSFIFSLNWGRVCTTGCDSREVEPGCMLFHAVKRNGLKRDLLYKDNTCIETGERAGDQPPVPENNKYYFDERPGREPRQNRALARAREDFPGHYPARSGTTCPRFLFWISCSLVCASVPLPAVYWISCSLVCAPVPLPAAYWISCSLVCASVSLYAVYWISYGLACIVSSFWGGYHPPRPRSDLPAVTTQISSRTVPLPAVCRISCGLACASAPAPLCGSHF